MARKIRHSLHPEHILKQHESPWSCVVCKRRIWSIGYTCSECWWYEMHMRCAQASGEIDAADDDEEQSQSHRGVIRHPSHRHELRLSRSCSFKCDACGTTRKGNSCTCIACEYWIHERCAKLPQNFTREDHEHSLSLCFHLPLEYIIYDYKCDVCYQSFLPKYWVYHCQLCRVIFHINCAFKKSPRPITINAANENGIIQFPVNDVGEKLITPFVKRQVGGGCIPHADGGMVINGGEEQIRAFVMRQGGGIPPIIPHDEHRFDFLHHKHRLTLISSSSTHDDQNQEEEEEEEEEDDYGKRRELICDGCITPIFSSSSSLSSSSSSSSSSEKYYYYMSCSECKYYLHMACFYLPHELPSLPFLHHTDHDLILRSCDKLKPWEYTWCAVCNFRTNGLFYACKRCEFKADIKCASMPETIYHAAHPQHLLNLLSEEGYLSRNYSPSLSCAADCGDPLRWYSCYVCDSCDFVVHTKCVVLPESTTSRRWDEHHPLPLTRDASLNHPGDFYCDQCETQMNPKSWMYHCRHCDLSFHPECFPIASGRWRNFKLGQQYDVKGEAAHPHPLTYQLLTTKRRCDLCHRDWHGYDGFHCASCNFFICFFYCGRRLVRDGNIHGID